MRSPSKYRHPAVRKHSELTLGERAADHMRAGMGSWPFVFGALGFLAIWMIYNRNSGFDRYPFILLNLLLSCLAAMQGAILLIAAKRADTISSEIAKHTENNTEAIKTMLTQNTELTKEIHALSRSLAPAHEHDI